MDRIEIIKQMLNTLTQKPPKRMPSDFDNGLKGSTAIVKIIDYYGVISAGEIAEKLNLTTPRVAVALNMLEGKGIIEKTKDEKDGRKTIVKLTKKGKIMLEDKKTKIEQNLLKVFQNLTDEELVTFVELIKKIC